MIIIFRIILTFSIFAFSWVEIKHALLAFQQNRYELFRYTKWLKSQKKDKEDYLLFFYKVIIFIVLAIINKPLLTLIAALALTALKHHNEAKVNYIKPLVFTERVNRQALVILVLYLVVNFIILSVFKNSGFVYALLLILMPHLAWCVIYPMFYITEPIEKAIREYFISQARDILRSSVNLKKIGITGSYGKTSTKNIVQAVISDKYYSLMTPASFNTPLGITITVRNDLKPLHEVFVCEMGADKVGEIDYLTKFVKPEIGIVTSIGPQHLNTFGSLENIITEKMLMIENLPADGIGILNYDNKYIREYSIKNTCRIVTCGIENEDVDYRAVDIEYNQRGSKFNVLYKGEKYAFQTRLLGGHNILNILISVALAREMGVEFKEIQKAVSKIEKIEHRLEIKQINGFTFIDNAFNSNPEGSAMSLEVMKMMDKTRWVITPGMIDLGDIQEEANYHFGELMKDKVDKVILVGANQTKPIYNGLKDSGFDMNDVTVVNTVKEAFSLVYENAEHSDTILLENDLPDAFSN